MIDIHNGAETELSLQINPHNYDQLLFDNVPKAMLRGKVVISTNGANTGADPRGNISLDSYPHPYREFT